MTAKPDLLQRLLARLILRHPFLATLALRLERSEDPTTATAWTDGVHLAVNPAYMAGLSDEESLTLVAHECYHVALGHHLRRRGRDLARWNRACDFAANALLVADGFVLYPNALYDHAYGDASAEAIYNQLAPPSPSSHASPAASTGTDAAVGEVRDLPLPTPPTPGELENLLAEHAVTVTALAQQARAQGRDSASARRAASTAAQHTALDWRALLVEFLTSRHEQDYSWSRPNPRYAALGVFLPHLRPAAPGSVAFVLDTSGSVPKAALDAVTAELEAYLRQFPTLTLEVLYADARVAGRVSLTAADLPFRLEPVGGGGTDFGPALQAFAEAEEPPACIVYLTDLDGAFPEEPPAIPVLWLVFGQPLALPEAPFGRVVALPY